MGGAGRGGIRIVGKEAGNGESDTKNSQIDMFFSLLECRTISAGLTKYSDISPATVDQQ